jgi:steroid delta-isomerase-like uncharacterized protein
MTDNSSIARNVYESWNERDFDKLADSIAPDGQITIVGSGDKFEGPDGARAYNKTWADGFPDGRVTIDRIVAAENSVVVEFTGRGTHTGTLVTSMGSLPPTGRSLTLQLIDVLEFSGGKIKAQRSYFDTGSLMAQLGVTAEQLAKSQ